MRLALLLPPTISSVYITAFLFIHFSLLLLLLIFIYQKRKKTRKFIETAYLNSEQQIVVINLSRCLDFQLSLIQLIIIIFFKLPQANNYHKLPTPLLVKFHYNEEINFFVNLNEKKKRKRHMFV